MRRVAHSECLAPSTDVRTAHPIWRALAQIGRQRWRAYGVSAQRRNSVGARGGNLRRWLNGTFRRIVSTGGKWQQCSLLSAAERAVAAAGGAESHRNSRELAQIAFHFSGRRRQPKWRVRPTKGDEVALKFDEGLANCTENDTTNFLPQKGLAVSWYGCGVCIRY